VNIEDQVELGYVSGVHGVRGDIKVKLHAATPEPLTPGVALSFRVRGGGPVTRRLELAKLAMPGASSSEFRLSFVGVDRRELAEELKGHGLWIDRADLPEPAEDEYYLHDLIGLTARHAIVELELGEVVGVASNGPQDLLELSWRDDGGAEHKWLCPALPGIVIDADRSKLTLDPVEGFMPDALEARFAELFAEYEKDA
jgi:16S rRNA processing protein RimM